MNKIRSTKERTFISLVGPSGSGKSHFVFDYLKISTLQPAFDENFSFLSILSTSLYSNAKKKP